METTGYFDDVKKMFAETDRRMAESRAETDRRMAESRAELDRKMQETAAQMKETDRKVAEVSRQIGALGNRLGEFVEWVIKPGLVRIFREYGLEVHQVTRDFEVRRGDDAMQIDLLVIDDTEAVAVEVKSKLTTHDVDEHIVRLGKFKRMSPQYAPMRVYGALAAMVLPPEAVTYAERKGLFVIGHKGDDAIILNARDFKPTGF